MFTQYKFLVVLPWISKEYRGHWGIITIHFADLNINNKKRFHFSFKSKMRSIMFLKISVSTYQNPTKSRVGFSEILDDFFAPMLQCGLQKRYNFFYIRSFLGFRKYVGQKFSLYLFSQKFLEFVCFTPFYLLFFKKVDIFWLKWRILVENRQTKTFSKKWNVWVFEMLLHILTVQKTSNWNKLWLFKRTLMMEEMEKFSYSFKKSSNLD